MIIFVGLIIFLFLLVLSTIASSFIYAELKVVTKVKYESNILFLPSFLSILSWVLVYYFMSIVISKSFNIDIYTTILNTIMLIPDPNNSTITLFGLFLIFSCLGIILQSLILMLVNIEYDKFPGMVKKVLKIKVRENTTNVDLVYNDFEKLKYTDSLLTSIFLFTSIFLICIVFYSIGSQLSNNFFNVSNN